MFLYLLNLSLLILLNDNVLRSSKTLFTARVFVYIACKKPNFSLHSTANRCLLKVAQYSAEMEVYDRASELYEQVGYFDWLFYF